MAQSSVIGPTAGSPTGWSARSDVGRLLRATWRIAVGALVLLVLFLAWLVVVGNPYEPGSDLGYNLGLAGGLLMLSLLAYPLRKRIRGLDRLGRMPNWFRYHMVAGIGGPILILFHSTFRPGSMNGTVALYAMLIVAFSGVVGRFLYRHVYRGLSGRHRTLKEVQEQLRSSSRSLAVVFVVRPDLEARLHAFQEEATRPIGSVGGRVWRFVTLRARSRIVGHQVRRAAREALMQLERRVSPTRRYKGYRRAARQIDAYLEAAVDVAHLAIWERLFSSWHVIHVPFLYLLVVSAVIHVVAVHMY
jgi:hypothetical protein